MGLSVYIHVPYCLKRCPYCDFNTYAVTRVPEDEYVAALLREIESAAKRPPWNGRRIETVFFGGGTPSLLTPDSVGRILERLDEMFGIEVDAEVSLEANPGSLEGSAPERLAGLRRAGVNRLSIGAQSFDDRHLSTLGRIHQSADTIATVAAARSAGIENLSLDLIFAVPGQSIDDWKRDLERVIELSPEHISAYGLTYEEGTPIQRDLDAGKIERVREETEAAMYETCISMLAGAGYRHYEISNFARPGYQCRHNMTYWSWEDYLGLGAGAHGFYRCTGASPSPQPCSEASGEDRPWAVRYANVRSPGAYMAAAPGRTVEHAETVSRETAMSEFILLGLRLIDGLPLARFEHVFGTRLDCRSASYRFLARSGFLHREDGHLRLTRRGLLLADSVIARLAAG
ncbi:MAG: radical SAM family heme chaperone HemW [Deltaproteobacteria bacterium]|nr:MAG: radical SAM family heme chaperone HemW [Deltaproteobacteria bacterium]